MIPSRPSRIFRSRWAALFWAAGVIWTAISVVGFGSPDTGAKAPVVTTDDSGAAVTNADLEVLRNFVNG